MASLICEPVRVPIDTESEEWIDALEADGERGAEALQRLHALLLRAARFEIDRRRASVPHLRGDDWDDLAHQAADDALVAVLRKLDGFRGESRFSTWAYKFALLEAAVKVRRRAWQGRELPLSEQAWEQFATSSRSAEARSEMSELLAAIQRVVNQDLTPHQREVLVAVALNDVPIDVLAERLD